MKFWIVRLDCTIICSYYSGSNSPVRAEKFMIPNWSPLAEPMLVQLIDHSRTISLSVYKTQLIYASVQSTQIYYRAKHGLLFAFGPDPPMPIAAIDNVVLCSISLYEEKCLNLNLEFKLPRLLNDYQARQLSLMRKGMAKIIGQMRNSHLMRRDSWNEEGVEEVSERISERHSQLYSISTREEELKASPVKFERQTEKHVGKYRLKFILFCVFAGISIVGPLLIYRAVSSE